MIINIYQTLRDIRFIIMGYLCNILFLLIFYNILYTFLIILWFILFYICLFYWKSFFKWFLLTNRFLLILFWHSCVTSSQYMLSMTIRNLFLFTVHVWFDFWFCVDVFTLMINLLFFLFLFEVFSNMIGYKNLCTLLSLKFHFIEKIIVICYSHFYINWFILLSNNQSF